MQSRNAESYYIWHVRQEARVREAKIATKANIAREEMAFALDGSKQITDVIHTVLPLVIPVGTVHLEVDQRCLKTFRE